MNTKKGWSQQCMMSLFKKEATYDAGVTMSNANACGMSGFLLDPKWPDVIKNDKGSVTNYEHGNTQEITNKRTEFTYIENECKPNTLIGLAALALGEITSTLATGATASYRHTITPKAYGSALPSIQIEHLKGGLQYAYKGVKCNTLKITGEEGGYLNIEAGLIGSGTRATSATAFADKVTGESWMKWSNCKVFKESGANISIASPLTQDAQNISSGTPTSLHARFKTFEWLWNNNAKPQDGFGGAGVYQDIDYSRRAQDFKFTMLFSSSADLDDFINQNPCTIEFDLKGAIIEDVTQDFYYGMQLIIPRFYIKGAPLPVGGVDDELTVEFVCECLEHPTYAVGGNPAAVVIEGYNTKAAYLAA